jgi:hypothetical protein
MGVSMLAAIVSAAGGWPVELVLTVSAEDDSVHGGTAAEL